LTDENWASIHQNRQADAGLLDKADAATLRFGCHQDALDFAAHSVERSNRMLAIHNAGDVIQGYRKGDIHIVADFRVEPNAEKYNLVISAVVPDGRDTEVAGNTHVARKHSCAAQSDGIKGFMFGAIRKLVESPESVIPSAVSIEPFKERSDFRRQVLASAFGIVPHVNFRWPEGKLAGLGFWVSGELGDRKAELVENCTKVVSGLKDDMGQVVGKAIGEFDLMKVCNAIRIFLNDMGPWFVFGERLDLGVQFGNLRLCAAKHTFGTSEVVGHGKISRSDKESRLSKGGAALPSHAAAAA
jgi:hypothetical protein